MSKVCEICEKRRTTGHRVSHSMRHTKRSFLPNLVYSKVNGKRTRLCTACLRTSSKVRV